MFSSFFQSFFGNLRPPPPNYVLRIIKMPCELSKFHLYIRAIQRIRRRDCIETDLNFWREGGVGAEIND